MDYFTTSSVSSSYSSVLLINDEEASWVQDTLLMTTTKVHVVTMWATIFLSHITKRCKNCGSRRIAFDKDGKETSDSAGAREFHFMQ